MDVQNVLRRAIILFFKVIFGGYAVVCFEVAEEWKTLILNDLLRDCKPNDAPIIPRKVDYSQLQFSSFVFCKINFLHYIFFSLSEEKKLTKSTDLSNKVLF